jgi:hypothetical protein
MDSKKLPARPNLARFRKLAANSESRLRIAREHGFENWVKFARHVDAVTQATSPVCTIRGGSRRSDRGQRDETAAHAAGESEAGSRAVDSSTSIHLAAYVSANGVEDFRQKTPKNIVDVAKILIDAGAEVDAENNPGRGTTLGLVATSAHQRVAGVQIVLLELLSTRARRPMGFGVDGIL